MNGPADRREGMALLVVLLLVAVMSVLAMGVLDDIRFGMRRAHNSETMAQARWFALGSEDLAKVRLRAINKGEITNISGGWANQDMTFPIDDGVMRATLRDGGNCFNLNSVVEGKGDFLQLRNEGVAQFMSLLTALKVSEPHARELSFALVDWMDTDRAELGSGGEDSTYSRLDPPYRTSQTLLAEPSELKVIRGFTPEIYKTLRPFVCALPDNSLSVINPNTLRSDRSLLLAILSGGALSETAAKRLIEARPEGGYKTLIEILERPELKGLALSDSIRQQVSLKSRYFTLEAEVDYAGAEAYLSALIEDRGSQFVTHSHSFSRVD